MKIQLYHINTDNTVCRVNKNELVGIPVFQDINSDEVSGFVYDYNYETNVSGICLYKPQELSEEDSKLVVYYEEEVDWTYYFKKMMDNNPESGEKWRDIIKKCDIIDKDKEEE